MTDVNDFVIAHGSRMLGIAEVALFTVGLVLTRKTRDSSGREALWHRRPLGIGVICVAASLLIHFPPMPNAFDWLTFKRLGVGSAMLGAGYAFILFAIYRFFGGPVRANGESENR
jgi:hypothetical protein